MFTLCPYYVYYVCDDFPSVVLYLDHNNSKETSSLSTPNDNAPVFLCLWIKIHLKKNWEFVKKFFSGKVDNFHTLHLQFHILVFHIIKFIICFRFIKGTIG